ncbi:MAG: 7-carboxy-7-deazaguanine synthase QueE [Chloroflexi bacterium]|nr:7-carboxy-7-deazaguanine synthase QueE [Chloroflexota bacterium]
MRVSEIFFSLQGEGVNIGHPAVFLRLAGCNLRCLWCDSKYTWDEGQELSCDEILERVRACPCQRLVITGGEPLLQDEDIAALLARLPDWKVEIETNGTVLPSQAIVARAQLNVSPKLASSRHTLNVRFKPHILGTLARKDASFKFVVDSADDLAEVEMMVRTCGIPAENVILMPQGVDEATIVAKARELVEHCKERGYRLLPRFHVTLFGNQRGV